MEPGGGSMLEIEGLHGGYGLVRILRDVDLRVRAGEVVALLGRNGAGKTTLLRTVMGLLRPAAGRILLDGVDLARLPAHAVPRLGVAYVPQGRGLFRDLSVAENLRMGMLVRESGPEALDSVLDLFPVLRARMRQRAGTLSGGQQQMLATARALCLEPKLLLLDEPGEGLMPSLVEQLMHTVAELRSRGVGVLLVEQKVDAALRVADRVVFMENGAVRHESDPERLALDPEPLLRYVGVRGR